MDRAIKFILPIILNLIFVGCGQGVTINGATLSSVDIPSEGFCDSTQQGIYTIGDSITMAIVGDASQYGYRKPLQSRLGLGCYNMLGGLNNPGSEVDNFDNDHEGHSGKTCTYLRDNVFNVATRFDGYADKTKSWIILHCGTNDIAACVDTPYSGGECTSGELDAIVTVIEDMVEQAELDEPDVNMIVVYPGPHDSVSNNNSMNSLRPKLDTMIDTNQSGGKANLYGLDMYEIYGDYGQTSGYGTYYHDYVHPNPTGHSLMSYFVHMVMIGNCADNDACNAP